MTRNLVIGLLVIDRLFLQKRMMFLMVSTRSLDFSMEVRKEWMELSYSELFESKDSNYSLTLINILSYKLK